MVAKKSYDQFCPIARTLDILGDRWTMLIVRDLFLGKSRFSEFLAESAGMPPKVLSDRLKRLTDLGLVERSVYSEHPLRAEYHLTVKGRTLWPVLDAIIGWGIDHFYGDRPELQGLIRERVDAAVREYAAKHPEPANAS
jgi:DNA-binding HxlR family transcriptional regulator